MGVVSIITKSLKNTDDMMQKSMEAAREAGYIREREKVVVSGGVPVWEPGSANLLRVCESRPLH